MVHERLGPESVVITVFPDDNKKYLSTDLLREEPVKDGFLTPDVELEEFDAFKRVCNTCWDSLDCVHTELVQMKEILAQPLRQIPTRQVG